MGEYAKRKSDGQEVKIGTCESMYYLRYEDRHKVEKIPHSLDASREINLFWRIPFPDEDAVNIGEYDPYNRGQRLYRSDNAEFSEPGMVGNPGIIQLHHESGLLLNVPCYHGIKLPDVTHPMKAFWNGKSWSMELRHVKNTSEGVLPVIGCRHCGQLWRASWEEILTYIPNDEGLRERLEVYSTVAV